MKLKNKKTGEIGFLVCVMEPYPENITVVECIDGKRGSRCWHYNTIAELNEEWEDYEEPETFWYMTAWGDVKEYSQDQFAIKQKQAIGNYFETEEEAEKALEKLKAWKRLKDKGFEFTGWDRHPDYPGDFRITASDEWTCDDKDLDLLFGGEE